MTAFVGGKKTRVLKVAVLLGAPESDPNRKMDFFLEFQFAGCQGARTLQIKHS